MACADKQLALDVAVADAAPVVRALVIDHDEGTTLEARHRDRPGTMASGHDPADRHEADVMQLRATIIRVVAELVEELRVDGSHEAHATGTV